MNERQAEPARISPEREEIKKGAIRAGHGDATMEGWVSGLLNFFGLIAIIVVIVFFLGGDSTDTVPAIVFASPFALAYAIYRGRRKAQSNIEKCVQENLKKVECPFCSTPYSWKFIASEDRLISAVPRSQSRHAGHVSYGYGERSSITEHNSWVDEVHEVSSFHECVTCGESEVSTHTVRRKTGKKSSKTW